MIPNDPQLPFPTYQFTGNQDLAEQNPLYDFDEQPVLRRDLSYEDDEVDQVRQDIEDRLFTFDRRDFQQIAWERRTREAINVMLVAYEDEIEPNQQISPDVELRKPPLKPEERIREKPIMLARNEEEDREVTEATETFFGSSLLNACKIQDVEGAKFAINGIKYYATLNMQDFYNRTSMSYAIEHSHDIVELIIEKLVGFLYDAFGISVNPESSAQEINIANEMIYNIIEQLHFNGIGIEKICTTLSNNKCSIDKIMGIEHRIKKTLISIICKIFNLVSNPSITNTGKQNAMHDLNSTIKRLFDYGIRINEITHILSELCSFEENKSLETFISDKYRSISNSQEVKNPE